MPNPKGNGPGIRDDATINIKSLEGDEHGPKEGLSKSWGNVGHKPVACTKPDLHGTKVMLCVWWDQLGVVYYELLKQGQTVTGELYKQQLQRLSRALRVVRPQYRLRHDNVILQHDNARPHTSQVVKEYLNELNWEVLSHPPYSPDLAPSDYHLFRSMAHGLADQQFETYDQCQKWVNDFFQARDPEFWRRGIRMLPERWAKVVANDGQYFE